MLIGPSPPPVDGRALATSWLVDALRADGHVVRVFNTHISELAKVRSCFGAAMAMLFGTRPDRVIVVASGGSGLAIESVPLLVARLRGIPAAMTHHSARYVRERSWLFRFALAAGGPRLRHAVLDDAMGAEMAEAYGIDRRHIVVVDNAGLMPKPNCVETVAHRDGVVHLSNLSVAKGLAAVLDVAVRSGIEVRLIGTVSSEAAAVLDSARSERVPFVSIGPRHGDEKQRELLGARCFLFLSSYQHEAQPLVLYEAMSAGCVPLVWNAGWVGEQMCRVGLRNYVFPIGDVNGVTAALSGIVSMDEETFSELSSRVQTAFEKLQEETSTQYKRIIA